MISFSLNIQVFSLNPSLNRGECACKDNYVLWPKNGECYKAFTPGPCRVAEFIIPEPPLPPSEGPSTELVPLTRGGGSGGKCVQNPCPRAHLYFPEGDDGDTIKCHKVGSRGPCPLGELVVFEKYSGKSYRGECGCSPGYNQNYWPDTGMCYEWYSQGPCKESFLFQFNKDSGHTECVCDGQEGFMFWNETGQCYRVYTQGPCPDFAWLIPGEENNEVFCECRTGYHFDPVSYTCEKTITSVTPISPGPVAKRLEPLALPLLPYAGKRGSWAHLSLVEKLRQRQQLRRQQLLGAQTLPQTAPPPEPPIQWSKGIFVTPGHTGIARRNDAPEEDTTTAAAVTGDSGKGGPDYSWIAEQWERTGGVAPEKMVGAETEGGWGAKALPRVARNSRLADYSTGRGDIISRARSRRGRQRRRFL